MQGLRRFVIRHVDVEYGKSFDGININISRLFVIEKSFTVTGLGFCFGNLHGVMVNLVSFILINLPDGLHNFKSIETQCK